MDYIFIEPPKGTKRFKEMNKEEAYKYLEWYLSEVPKRVELLIELYHYMGGESEKIFDYTRESLNPLWKWYLHNVNVVPLSEAEIKKKFEKAPEHIKPFLLKEEIELGWKQVALDIGIYFGICMIKNSTALRWGVQTEPADLADVNKPVIIGFPHGIALAPDQLMVAATGEILRGKSTEESLVKKFDIWTEMERK